MAIRWRERRDTYRSTRDDIYAAIVALSGTKDSYPSPLAVANQLGISRQLLHKHVLILERAGMITRLYRGHALKALKK